MLDNRLVDRRGALLAFRAEGMRAFHDGPAVVAASFDLVDHLPQILADFAAPEVAGLAIEAVAPKLPQAVSVNLGASTFGFDEGIVLRNAVRLAGWRIIDIDAQQLGEDAGKVLADIEFVGDAGAISRHEVEIAVGAEADAAAVVAAVGPFEDDLLRGAIGGRRLALDGKARHARAFRRR